MQDKYRRARAIGREWAETEAQTEALNEALASRATFERYIAHGRDAAATHPDFEQLDFETAAVDTIASLLHAIEDEDGTTPEEARDDPSPRAEEVLARAWRSYRGDFEELR